MLELHLFAKIPVLSNSQKTLLDSGEAASVVSHCKMKYYITTLKKFINFCEQKFSLSASSTKVGSNPWQLMLVFTLFSLSLLVLSKIWAIKTSSWSSPSFKGKTTHLKHLIFKVFHFFKILTEFYNLVVSSCRFGRGKKVRETFALAPVFSDFSIWNNDKWLKLDPFFSPWNPDFYFFV